MNAALRHGLQEWDEPSAPRKPVRAQPMDLGQCLLGSIDDVGEVLAVAQGEAFQ